MNFTDMRYSRRSGMPGASFMPQRGHTPGDLERTSGSMGQENSTAAGGCAARANTMAAAGISARMALPQLGRRLVGPSGGGGEASVDGDDLAGHVIGTASGQEDGQRRDVLGRAGVGVGLRALEPVAHVLPLPHVAVEVGDDES